MSASVVAVHRDDEHAFSKRTVPSIVLLAGLGVEGDAHCGATVRHRSRVAVDPGQPNLRQVHLLSAETLRLLTEVGFDIGPGALGENITTNGLDLHGLPTGTLLRLGDRALIALTGSRNPCRQIEDFRTGLLAEVVSRQDGQVVRRAGVMGVVLEGGAVSVGDQIDVQLPPAPHHPLLRV